MSDPDLILRPPGPRSFLPWLWILNLALLLGVGGLSYWRSPIDARTVQGLPAVVAKVNGRPLFARDLFSAAPPSSTRPSDAQLRSALDRMIREEVVAQNVPAVGGSPDAILATLRLQMNDPGQESAALSAAGLTEPSLRARLTRHLQIRQGLLAAARRVPSEQDCRAWFAAHPEIADLPEVAQASHCAAIWSPRKTPQDVLEKNALLSDMQTRLREGIPFPQLIDALSDDPAQKSTHGSLFWFRRERMETSLVEAAFAQPLQVVGPPVATRFGWHLLQVAEHRPAARLTYEEVAPEVRRRCSDEMQRKKIETLVADWLQRAKVEIFAPGFTTHPL
jgi:foldase protein PrsA